MIGLSVYDRSTERALTNLVERELTPGSGKDAMEIFLRKHVDGYHLDDRINFEYIGIRKQSRIDKILFRKVQIILYYDNTTNVYIWHKITVFYTFL